MFPVTYLASDIPSSFMKTGEFLDFSECETAMQVVAYDEHSTNRNLILTPGLVLSMIK